MSPDPVIDGQELAGWGRTAPTRAQVTAVTGSDELSRALAAVPERGIIARGLGRAYGDAAQNAGGAVADLTGWTGLLDLDLEHGRVTATAGTSLEQVMRWLVPLGWFVPVTPGTRSATVGGAVAADIHGKNHHHAGSFMDHVSRLVLELPGAAPRTVGPDADPELFWATAGGMGLTGIVRQATFDLVPIETSRLVVDTHRTPDLDDTMARMVADDDRYPYSVAWTDLRATGRSMGRSVLDQARFARRDELPARQRPDPLAFAPRVLAPAPPWAPPHLLNRLSIRAFNELWFRKAPRAREGSLQTITQFFHPLDAVSGWNRVYGRSGFLQWQCLVPYGEEATLRRIVERFATTGCASFLCVLKRFGAQNPGPLSFPGPGWTLAVDIPGGLPDLGPLLDDLDLEVAEAGGRLYLAKDSRMRPEILSRTYRRLDEWRSVRARVDPQGVLQSDLGRRLGLC
jgi:decaprenylphospho-beta-D-ribofuranose 2-oxidase